MGKLTDAAVKNAKPGVGVDGEGKPRAKSNRLQDGEGLSLLVKPNGCWICIDRKWDKLQTHTIREDLNGIIGTAFVEATCSR